MSVIWKLKTFDDLTVAELYEILALRNEVFVVEQHCAYQDLDGKDRQALHLLGFDQEEVVAYSRLFDAGMYFETAAIGRVVVSKAHRAQKLGHQLIQQAIKAVKEQLGKDQITISAQCYLLRFYKLHGFKPVGNEYLEDGIPHIEMRIG